MGSNSQILEVFENLRLLEKNVYLKVKQSVGGVKTLHHSHDESGVIQLKVAPNCLVIAETLSVACYGDEKEMNYENEDLSLQNQAMEIESTTAS